LGDGSSAQISIHKNNMSLKKYVYRYNHNNYIENNKVILFKGY